MNEYPQFASLRYFYTYIQNDETVMALIFEDEQEAELLDQFFKTKDFIFNVGWNEEGKGVISFSITGIPHLYSIVGKLDYKSLKMNHPSPYRLLVALRDGQSTSLKKVFAPPVQVFPEALN